MQAMSPPYEHCWRIEAGNMMPTRTILVNTGNVHEYITFPVGGELRHNTMKPARQPTISTAGFYSNITQPSRGMPGVEI